MPEYVTWRELSELLDRKFDQFRDDLEEDLKEKRDTAAKNRELRFFVLFSTLSILANLIAVYSIHITAR